MIIKKVFFLLFVLVAPLSAQVLPRLNINIVSQMNGRGLETDQKILKEALEELHQTVTCVDFEEKRPPKADINIFFQDVVFEKLQDASLNWFVPNPEWYAVEPAVLEKVDLILCRTKMVEEIFQRLNKKTYYLGFSSPDCYLPGCKKNFSAFFHLAGGSAQKGSLAIYEVWQKNEKLPSLALLCHYQNFYPILVNRECKNLQLIFQHLSERHLHYYQNRCGIHLCPSEAEGFSHTIVEGLAAGAVVVTTDAPPMNEHITDPRCLVPYKSSIPQRLGTAYYVDEKQLEIKIEALLALPLKERQAIGRQNRQHYENMTEAFHGRLKQLLDETCSGVFELGSGL